MSREFFIPSARLGHARPILVQLPASYRQSNGTRYPVLYVLDGESHFRAIAASVDYLAEADQLPEMIVVGIPSLGRRSKDYTPAGKSPAKRVPVAGGADTIVFNRPDPGGAPMFRRFLMEELQPWIQRHYRTAPFAIISGHSLGGLFVIDLLRTAPHAFQVFIANSPGLSYDEGRYQEGLLADIDQQTFDHRVLHLSTCEGEPEFTALVQPLSRALVKRSARGLTDLRWSVGLIPDETHMSCALPGTMRGLRRTFEGWALPDSLFERALIAGSTQAAEAHYAALAAKLGYPITLPLMTRIDIGDAIRRAGRDSTARRCHAPLASHGLREM